MSDKVLGIDEAGRGCVLGDLVLSGVLADKKQQEALRKLGCADSKSFGSGIKSYEKRKALAKQIAAICPVNYQVRSPAVIDKNVPLNRLNLLECQMAEKIMDCFKFDRAVLDGDNIFKSLSSKQRNIECYPKADCKEIVVAAASIMAKAKRDQLLLRYFDRLPPNLTKFKFKGWGYINAATLNFVQQYYLTTGYLPKNLRLSYNWLALRQWLNTTQGNREKNILANTSF